MNDMTAPKLRFLNDEGGIFQPWIQVKLGEISTFLDGKRKPIKESDRAKMQGPYPYYGASGIIDYVNDYIFDDAIILLGEDGENIASRNLPLAILVTEKCWVNNHAHVIKPHDGYDIRFLVERLENISYDKYNSGTAQPKLNQAVCKNITFYIPQEVQEQEKIASFLSAIEQKISFLTQKYELLTQYKKGVMQKIFNQEIRFRDDAGGNYPDWEIKSIKDCAEVIMGQSPSSSSYNQEGDGVFLIQGNADIKNRRIFPRAWTTEKTKSCIAGDIILTVRAPVGAVAISDHSGCIGRGVCAIRTNKENSAGYIYQLLIWYESFKWKSLEQGSTFTAVNGNDIKTLDCPMPSISEQEKISHFLSALDEKISNVQKQIDLTKQYKQGLLQQMFI